ncbi:hypothetical protein [Fuchsiella alkaliacetigena]|uniref:hypothetical protein n=1 Tax=Fuchsiella alkaliacetigena TaxID=957042 RepID=UPI00200B1989|nr:hypothetical protein [Fuchsiella alkaliacetigena]MCK8823756.1 hypothetical protein [Fuchsiella alkaliacetigena]
MIINRLIEEVRIELEEANKLLAELEMEEEADYEESKDDQYFLWEITKQIIDEQENLLSNLEIDELATVISKLNDRYLFCSSCGRNILESIRLLRLPPQSLLTVKDAQVPPTEIVIVDVCKYCNYIFNFEFFKGQEAYQLYQLLIADLQETEFELEEKIKV